MTNNSPLWMQAPPANRSYRILSQLLKPFARLEFEALVKSHRGDCAAWRWWSPRPGS
jgi:hypothetical protein